MHWFYKLLAAVGGIGVILREVAKPLILSLTEKYFVGHDQPVWNLLLSPKFKEHYFSETLTFATEEEIPYSVEELAEKTKRARRSVIASLHRLEKRGKVKEVAGGWQRKET